MSAATKILHPAPWGTSSLEPDSTGPSTQPGTLGITTNQVLVWTHWAAGRASMMCRASTPRLISCPGDPMASGLCIVTAVERCRNLLAHTCHLSTRRAKASWVLSAYIPLTSKSIHEPRYSITARNRKLATPRSPPAPPSVTQLTLARGYTACSELALQLGGGRGWG